MVNINIYTKHVTIVVFHFYIFQCLNELFSMNLNIHILTCHMFTAL